jgi:hypothetical protein
VVDAVLQVQLDLDVLHDVLQLHQEVQDFLSRRFYRSSFLDFLECLRLKLAR